MLFPFNLLALTDDGDGFRRQVIYDERHEACRVSRCDWILTVVSIRPVYDDTGLANYNSRVTDQGPRVSSNLSHERHSHSITPRVTL